MRLLFVLWVLCSFLIHSTLAQKAYNLTGTTVALPNTDCYQITGSAKFQNGAIWYVDKVRLDRSFDLEFSMNFGDNDLFGADGMVFVIQTASNTALGKTGQGIGYAGFLPSLGVEFDTFQNNDENDPSFDHIAVFKNGVVNHTSYTALTSPIQASDTTVNIEDGKDHVIRISWNARKELLEVFFDCRKRISLTVNLAKDIFYGQKEAWWGFTGATGGSANVQTVCLRKDIVAKDTFQICKGDVVGLVARNAIDNQYTWSPAVFIDDPHSRTPLVRPDKSQFYTVSYRDFCNEQVSDSVFVEVTALPTLDLGPDLEPCDTLKKVLLSPRISPRINDVLYTWNTTATTDTIGVTQTGIYRLDINAKGCRLRDSVRVTFRPTPVVPAVSKPYFCLRDRPLTLDPAATNPDWQFLWTPTAQTASTIQADLAGIYQVRIRNQFNCSVTRTFVVRDDCPPDLYVPDMFTPNGDGQNDTFEVKASEDVLIELTIFDRWGKAIFYSDSLTNAWTGLDNSQAVPGGVYAWKVRYAMRRVATAPVYEKTGQVLLAR